MVRKILIWTGVVLFVLLGATALYVMLRWKRTFDAPTPSLQHSGDSSVIAAGKYLAYGPAHCAYCHTTVETAPALDRGERPPLVGGFVFAIPVAATGRIAMWTEEQFLARFRRGRLLPGTPMPWNAFARMSDDDLRAIYRYLRTLSPVRRETGPSLRSEPGKPTT